ncbi:L-gulonolactone/D-arabinono-1,4-lactone oxidase [Atractiella rhizophila]|nr:L-gulonolactone/D-arabinono-1,4-lactone oxidase [Atractiella rhizophila]
MVSDPLPEVSNNELEAALQSISVTPYVLSNWARTFRCLPERVFRPKNVDDVRRILLWCKREGREVRVRGAAHSPSDLGMVRSFDKRRGDRGKGGVVVEMTGMSSLVSQDSSRNTVRVQGGMTISSLSSTLSSLSPPLALSCLGSISDQTLSGAISTATHGAGWNYGSLSSYVRSLTVVLADSNLSVIRCSATEEPDLFFASLCGLGCTSVIVEVEIEVEPAFNLCEELWEMPFSDFVENLEEILKSGEHARQFWFPHLGLVKCSRLNRTKQPPSPPPSFSSRIQTYLTSKYHETALVISRTFPSILPYHASLMYRLQSSSLPSTKSFDFRSEVSPENKVDTSIGIFNYDIGSPQYTYEGAVPVARAAELLRAMGSWLEKEEGRHHFPIEVRVVDEDQAWLAPTNGGRKVYVGMVQYRPFGLAVPYKHLFRTFESLLLSHEGRPHWAKAHNCSRTMLEKLYPRFHDFLRVRDRADPEKIFCNAYIRRHLLGEVGEENDMRVFKKHI